MAVFLTQAKIFTLLNDKCRSCFCPQPPLVAHKKHPDQRERPLVTQVCREIRGCEAWVEAEQIQSFAHFPRLSLLWKESRSHTLVPLVQE
jgi:hypothetical protein